MLEISGKTNLLEQKSYKYSLQDVAEPNLYRDVYPYTEVPKVAFNHRRSPMNMPKEIWITDTTFRDGQQSRAPYSTEQIVKIYDYLHKLGEYVEPAGIGFVPHHLSSWFHVYNSPFTIIFASPS